MHQNARRGLGTCLAVDLFIPHRALAKRLAELTKRPARPERCSAVKHGFLVTFGPLCLIFPEPARVRSLTIEAEISAAELPDPVSHNLHIIVDDECSA